MLISSTPRSLYYNIPKHGISTSIGYRLKRIDVQTGILLNIYNNEYHFTDITTPSLTMRYYFKKGVYFSAQYYYNTRRYVESHGHGRENVKLSEHQIALAIGWKIFHNWKEKKNKEKYYCPLAFEEK